MKYIDTHNELHQMCFCSRICIAALSAWLNIVKPLYLNSDKLFPWIPGRKIERVRHRKNQKFEDTKVLTNHKPQIGDRQSPKENRPMDKR